MKRSISNIVLVLEDIAQELNNLECQLSRATPDTDEGHGYVVGVGMFCDQAKDSVDRLINEGMKLTVINEEAA